jgi:hypothetical protein
MVRKIWYVYDMSLNELHVWNEYVKNENYVLLYVYDYDDEVEMLKEN